MFPEDALEKTPSREHMTLAEELKARQKVVEDMRGLAHRTGLCALSPPTMGCQRSC
jgi:hypothetical protein